MKLIILLISLFLSGGLSVDFHIVNNEQGEIWVGILGNPGHEALANGGFKLSAGETRIVSSPANWAGRFWGRTWCNLNGDNHCLTGDCGNKLECLGAGGTPPVTLAEITLKGHEGLDFYDISLVDGYNIKSSIGPLGGTGDCKRVGCDAELKPNCPAGLEKWHDNQIISCNSACNQFDTDQYCCRGDYDQPETCNPDHWEVNSASYFKQGCPDAYSYAYDDQTSTFTCTDSQAYQVTFG